MSLTFGRAGLALAIAAATGALASCGSSSTLKIKDAGFVTKCESSAKAKDSRPQDQSKLAEACTCVQQKLVAQGFGNRDNSDKSADLNNAANGALSSCLAGLIGGSSGSGTPTTGTAGGASTTGTSGSNTTGAPGSSTTGGTGATTTG